MTKHRCFIAIHANWSTKGRVPIIGLDEERVIREEIAKQLYRMDCPFVAFGAAADHVHVLFLLNSTRSCEYVFRAMKSASTQAVTRDRQIAFAWQYGYAAFSVGKPGLQKAIDYVTHQRERHARGTTLDIYE